MMQALSRRPSQQVGVGRTVVVEQELQQEVPIGLARVVKREEGVLLLIDVPLPIPIGNVEGLLLF